MTGTNHTLVGAIIAVTLPPPLVPAVALISHFVLDALPHFGRHPEINPGDRRHYPKIFKYWLVGDAILCFTALFGAWALFPNKWLIITIGAFFAAGPDFLWLLEPHAKTRWAKKFFAFAKWIQWGERPWGWILEIIYGFLFASLLFTLSE